MCNHALIELIKDISIPVSSLIEKWEDDFKKMAADIVDSLAYDGKAMSNLMSSEAH